MYNNIGRTIKILSHIILGVGVGINFIIWICLMMVGTTEGTPEMIVIGLLWFIIGVALSWCGSLLIYGFGRLIENTDILVEKRADQDEENT